LVRALGHSVAHVLYLFLDPAPTPLYTLSLHAALPISSGNPSSGSSRRAAAPRGRDGRGGIAPEEPRCGRHDGVVLRSSTTCGGRDRKSTRLNSSHDQISYAVFCLKKKKEKASGAEPRA